MKKTFYFFIITFLLIFSAQSYAVLTLELTQGLSSAIPIAISPFENEASTKDEFSSIIANDLTNSGRFKIFAKNEIGSLPFNASAINFSPLKKLFAEGVLVGQVRPVTQNQFEVAYQFLSPITSGGAGGVLLKNKVIVNSAQLRGLAHHISDEIYFKMLGVRGIFSTRLAYVLVKRSPQKTQYSLEVSDQDGFNPRPLLVSTDPIMSPAWSPDGKRIAYVSFENRRASIYVEEVATGARRLVSQFSGINGAPAWSPDGKKLAVVLSKNGSPNIYILDLVNKKIRQLTNDFSINTEPAWAPNGNNIVFTSNRGGGPQIYLYTLKTGKTERISFDGDYNARASFSKDGNRIALLHKENHMFNVGLLDLNQGSFQLLTHSDTDYESPSMAPNGSMVLYGLVDKNRTILGMSSSDGKIGLKLPARDGDVQDPAWSPFLS